MAATSVANAPCAALAQPVSFTAEYLYCGDAVLQDNLPEDLLVPARGLYSLGVIVLAPVGILYHLSMAAYGALAQLRLEEGKEKNELCAWAWQHLDAAGLDLLGWGSALIGPFYLACLVGFSVLAMNGEARRGIPLLIPFIAFLEGNELINGIMLYKYAVAPGFWLTFLSETKAEGAQSSQYDLYLVQKMLRPAISKGEYVTNGPLLEGEVVDLKQTLDRLISSNDFFTFSLIEFHQIVKRYNRAVDAAAEAQTNALVALKPTLEAIRDRCNRAHPFSLFEAQKAMFDEAQPLIDKVKANPAAVQPQADIIRRD